MIAAVQRIGWLLLDTLSRLDGSQVPTAQSHTVRRAATDYLPTTLRRYLALPQDWAGGHDLGGGRTALDGLRAQLGTLEQAATEMRTRRSPPTCGHWTRTGCSSPTDSPTRSSTCPEPAVSNQNYNGSVPAAGSTSFGFQGSGTGTGMTAS